MKKLAGNMLLFIFLLGQITACQHKWAMTATEREKADQEENNRPNDIWPTNKNAKGDYYYSVSLNSFPGCISENAGSYFMTGKNRVAFLTMENGSWPKTTGAVLNNEYHPIPDSLYVRWLSIAEDKFYEGTFKMPSEILKKYFDEMWLTSASSRIKYEASKHERFEDLIVGVALGGRVMVWLGSLSQQIEIGCYQAEETQMDWNEFADLNGFGAGTSHHGYVEARKADVMSPVPFGKAEKYRTKFLWECSFEGNPDLVVTKYELYFYNGEIEHIYRNYKDGTNQLKERAVPYRLNFIVQEKGKKLYNFEIYFNEERIFEAFNTICGDKHTGARLVLMLDKGNKIADVVLRNGARELKLAPKDVKLFLDDYDPNVLPLKDK